MLLSCLLLCGSALQGSAQPAAHVRLSLSETGSASALRFESALLPGESLELVTAETILERAKGDFGVFSIKPGKAEWKTEKGELAYVWRTPEGLTLSFRARPEGDSIALEYTLENGTEGNLERLLVHPCLPTQGSVAFFPGTSDQAVLGKGGRAARVGKNDYTELWTRVFLWSKGKPFRFADSKLAKEEKHLAFMLDKTEPIEWSWWKNGEQTFDLPLIAVESKDKKHVLALGFEKALWASSNGGDPRACVHVFPSFGNLAKGAKATVHGRLYLLEGDAAAARERFLADFPALAH